MKTKAPSMKLFNKSTTSKKKWMIMLGFIITMKTPLVVFILLMVTLRLLRGEEGGEGRGEEGRRREEKRREEKRREEKRREEKRRKA